MPLYSWSMSAGTNATADLTINWAEGMAPSAVNDSARAMMAAIAKWNGDISGAITTSGTSTAYTLTSNSVLDSLAHMHNQMIAFVPHSTNGGAAGQQITLNVDGLGAKPIRFAPSLEIPSGTLVQGTPYVATYNNTDGAFYLQGLGCGNPYSIPLGAMLPYTGTTAPNSAFVLPFGQVLSQTTYATYYSLVGTTFNTGGEGAGNFRIIDMRGRLPIGQDNMGGSAASRVTSTGSSIDGATMGATGGAQTVSLTSGQIPSLTVSVTDSRTWAFGRNNTGVGGSNINLAVTAGSNGNEVDDGKIIVSGSITGTYTNNSQSAVNKMPPGIVVPYILRVI